MILSSCSAMRQVRTTHEQVDSVAREQTVTIVRDTVGKVVNQVVTQTVVEYYPVHDTLFLETPSLPPKAYEDIAKTRPAVAQPIKSITRTEIRTEAQVSATKDSVTLSDTSSQVLREYDTENTDPNRPTAAQYLKLAIFLVLSIALCILLIKIRLPRI